MKSLPLLPLLRSIRSKTITTAAVGGGSLPAVFTLAFLPDTQNHVDSGSPNMEPLEASIDWLVANKADLNLQFVAHPGDMVENWNDNTEWG